MPFFIISKLLSGGACNCISYLADIRDPLISFSNEMNHEVGLGLERGRWVNVPRGLIRFRWEVKKQRRWFQLESTGKSLINRSDGLCLKTTREYMMPNLTFLTWCPDNVNSPCIIFKWRKKSALFVVPVCKQRTLKRHSVHRSRIGPGAVKDKNIGNGIVFTAFIYK